MSRHPGSRQRLSQEGGLVATMGLKKQFATNQEDALSAARIVETFLKTSHALLARYGERTEWGDHRHAQASVMLANACATVYAAQVQERIHKEKKTAS